MRFKRTFVWLAYLSRQQQMFETVDVQKNRGQYSRKPTAHRRHTQQPRVDVKRLGKTDQHVGAAFRYHFSTTRWKDSNERRLITGV